MNGKLWLLYPFLVTALLALSYCSADELPQPEGCAPGLASYELNMKEIIDQSCAYIGCHDGQSSDAPGNFQTYAGIRPFLQDGTVRSRVIDLRNDPVKGMPPSKRAFPLSQKEELTPKEYELFRCWLNDNFPER